MRHMILITSLVVGLFAATRTATAQDFIVIVNEANPNRGISNAELGRVFQKQAGRWSNGLTTEPVDVAEGAPVRERFSRSVYAKSTAQVKAWWQAQIFSGRAVPPVEMATESQVIEYVQTHGGAIGYVSAGASLPQGVRRLTVTR